MENYALDKPSLIDKDVEKILDLLITYFRLGTYMSIPKSKEIMN